MKSKLLTICMFLAATFIISACQHDDEQIDNSITTDNDKQKVKFDLSISQIAFDVETGYEPMSRAQVGRIEMPNKFNYVILQKMDGGEYIVERSEEGLIDPTKGSKDILYISANNSSFSSLEIEIRPGKYEIVAFTGGAPFNPDIVEGMVIQPGDKIPAVSHYIESNNNFNNYNKRSLGTEVFYSHITFEIIKNNNLKPAITVQQEILNLERRVARLRIVLKDSEEPSRSFSQLGPQVETYVVLNCKRTDKKNFAEGLDIWGNLWYANEPDPNLGTFHVEHYFGGFINNSKPFIYEGENYLLPQDITREISLLMLTDPNEEIVMTTDYVEANRQRSSMAVYYDTKTWTVKNNNIYGVVLELSGYKSVTPNLTYYDMQEVEVDGSPMDPATFIPANYEYP